MNSEQEAVKSFETHIRSYAFSIFQSDLEISGLASHIKVQLTQELLSECTRRAIEVLGPSIAVLNAASPNKSQAELILGKEFFVKVSDAWESFVRNRCASLIQQIKDAENLLPGTISSFQCLDGDTHNNFHTPLKIMSEDNSGIIREFVYKSISAFPSKLAHLTGKLVTSELNISNFFEEVINETPASYIRKFTQGVEMGSDCDPDEYYYSFGAICAISSFLEITDLHFENIIATSSGPKVIDVEFLLSDSLHGDYPWNYISSGLFESNTSPIAQVGIHKFISPSIRVVKNEIQYHTFNKEIKTAHLFYREGVLVDPSKYISSMSKGARDADSVLKKCIFNMTENSIIESSSKIRYWIRSTAFYRIIQIQFWIPEGSHGENINVLKKKLNNSKSISRSIQGELKIKIVDAEIYDISRGDVPYFWIDWAGNLMHSTGMLYESWGNSFDTALRSQAKKWSRRSYDRNFNDIIKRMKSRKKPRLHSNSTNANALINF